MDKGIADYANICVACQANVFKQTPELMRMSKLPGHPRCHITMNLPGEEIFALMGIYSRYLTVEINQKYMKNTSAQSI